MHRFAIVYFLAQAIGGAAWWVTLLIWPTSRVYFRAMDAPDVTLLAFGIADGLLFVIASAGSAIGVWRRAMWANPVMWLHAGAAAYAAIYCWTLFILTHGDGWIGAMMMTPSLIVPGWLAWRLRSIGNPTC